MTYRVLVAPAARREIKKLPRTVQAIIIEVLRDLASDPRPSGCKQLHGTEGFSRVRSGDYRAVYTVEDLVLLVTVVKVAHRRDVYRDL